MDLSRISTENHIFKPLSPFAGMFLRCGVCLRFLTVPPIHVSSVNGVKICGRCFRANRYFRYKRDIDNAELEQNFLYEEFAKLFIFPCSYADCDKYVRFGESAEEHEHSCEHKQYRCPVSEPNRWFLRDGDVACNMMFKEEKDMIEHLENNHVDYILPGPCLHFRYVFLPYERRRMFVLITEGKMAVLFSKKHEEQFCVMWCRTFPSDVPATCEITVKDLQTMECVRQRRIACGPLDGDETEDVEQTFTIRLDILPARTMFYFSVKTPHEESEKDYDSKEDCEDMASGFILI